MPIFIFDPTGYSPEEIMEELGTLLALTYENAETELLAEAVKRADKILELQNDSKIAQQVYLQRLAVERATALKELREHSEAIVKRLREENLAETLVKYAAEHGSEATINQLQLIKNLPISTGFSGTAMTAVTALQMDLNNRLENLNNRILRFPNDVYQKVLAENAPALVMGLDTGLTNQKRIVRQFLSKNVDIFTDRSGRNWRIGSYAEMAGRTAAQRSWSDAAVYRMSQAGLDLVTPVVGYDGCEMCHNWSGKIISIGAMGAGTYQLEHGIEDRTVTVTVAGTLWEARNQGFQHPNCRCTLKAYIPGVTTLSESSYNPEAEAAAKKQRALEREIREAKREAALAPDEATRRRAQEDIYRAQQKLKTHLQETGRTRQSYREQLHFADGGTVNPRGVKPSTPPPSTTKVQSSVNQIPEKSDKEAWDVYWKERQEKLSIDLKGDDLKPIEVISLEHLSKTNPSVPLSQRIDWIPRSKEMKPTNDFYWLEMGSIPTELKSFEPDSKVDYGSIVDKITPAVSRAIKQNVIKENFIIDIGERRLRDGVLKKLENFNKVRTTNLLKRLFILSNAKLQEVNLK